MTWALLPLLFTVGAALGCAVGVYGVADHVRAPFVAIAIAMALGALGGLVAWWGWVL